MSSIFSRVYSYREREKKNNRENFLTEIFAYCLATDQQFRSKFLTLFSLPSSENLIVSTQQVYPEGIPDIVLKDEKSRSVILIESKIEHHERDGQLDDYKKILRTHYADSKSYLVYLTKYYDTNHYIDKSEKGISFKALKWAEIYKLINSDNSEITSQLKIYLKEQNMDSTKNFNYNDLTALTTIPNTISKMDEIFSHIKPAYINNLGAFPATLKPTKLPISWYGLSDERTYKNVKYWINTGFRWYYEDNTIYIGIRIWIFKEAAELIDNLKHQLKTGPDSGETTESWVHYDDDKGIVIENYRYLTDFITHEVDQLDAITKYLNSLLEELSFLK